MVERAKASEEIGEPPRAAALFSAIRTWASEKGLKDPHAQMRKHVAELGAVADALCRQDQAAFMDAVGRHLMTTIVNAASSNVIVEEAFLRLAQRNGWMGTLDEALEDAGSYAITAKTQWADIFENHVAAVGRISASLRLKAPQRAELVDTYGHQVMTLAMLAASKGVGVLDCLEATWGTVRERRGFTVDGIFVREAVAAGS